MDTPARAEASHRFLLANSSASYIGLVLVNVLLNIVTLTLYRFWGRTAIRRRLWAETSLDGESFEYTGRGFELFKGFLFATLLVFLPFVIVMGAAQAFLPPEQFLMVVAVVYPLGGFLAFAAIYLVRRYQLTRTQWRGIRFALDGSPWAFSLGCIKHLLLTLVTLGWWGPAGRQRVARNLWRNTSYGDAAFEFGRDEGNKLAGSTYIYFAAGWVIVIAALGLLGGTLGVSLAGSADIMRNPQDYDSSEIIATVATIYAVIFGAAFAMALAFLPYSVAAMRRTASLITFGEARFALRVTSMGLLWLVISNVLLVVFSLGFLAPLTQIRGWRFIIGRLEVEGPISLAAITQSVQPRPRSGEGLADGLDFGGV